MRKFATRILRIRAMWACAFLAAFPLVGFTGAQSENEPRNQKEFPRMEVSINGVALTDSRSYDQLPDQAIEVESQFVITVTAPGQLPFQRITVLCEGAILDQTNSIAKGWTPVPNTNLFNLTHNPMQVRSRLVTDANYSKQGQFITAPVLIGSNVFNGIPKGCKLGMPTHIQVNSLTSTSRYSVQLLLPGNGVDPSKLWFKPLSNIRITPPTMEMNQSLITR
jgi:hypothetical protein